MTTINYLRSTPAVERAEETLGGPLREVLRQQLNEPGITVSSIAKEIGVQKATVNYWMAKMSINYGRVAHYFDEEVRILSQDDARLLDAVLDMEASIEDIENLNPEDRKTLRRLEALGIPATDLAAMSASQIVAMRRLARLGLDDEQIDLIDAGTLEAIGRLTREGVTKDMVASINRAEIDFIVNARDRESISTSWVKSAANGSN